MISGGGLALCEAAKKGYLEITIWLLGHKADVNFIDSATYSALHYSAREGHLEISQRLIKAGADIDGLKKSWRWSTTPLIIAAQYGRTDIVKLLLGSGGSALVKERGSAYTALHKAAFSGHEDIVDILLMTEKIDANAKGAYKETPLHQAVLGGNINVVKRLLKCKVDVNAQKSGSRESALHFAVYNNMVDITRELLCHPDIDINLTDNENETCLHYAAEYKLVEIAQMLCQYPGIDVNKLNRASKNHKSEIVTPLFIAVRNSSVEIVKAIMSIPNVDITKECILRSNQRTHILRRYIASMQYEIFNALLSHKISNINLDDLLRSVLSNRSYTSKDSVKKARLLLEKGADANAFEYLPNCRYPTEDGTVTELTQLLLEFGAVPDRRYPPGSTQGLAPLQTCIFKFQYKQMKVMLKYFHSEKIAKEFWENNIVTSQRHVYYTGVIRDLYQLFERGKPNLIHYLHTIGYPAGKLFTPLPHRNDPRRMIANLNDPALREEWIQLMDIVNNEVLSLKLLSRITIRAQLYNKIPFKVKALALPEKMKDYITLNDYPDI